MKKLLLKLLLFAIILLLPLQLFLFLAPMHYQATDYVMWQHAWESCKKPADALLVGDSRAKAGIMPTGLDDDIQSLTVGGGTPVEGYYLIKEYLRHNDAPSYVVLSYAPFDLQQHGWLWERTIKNGFLPLADELEILRNYRSVGQGSVKDYAKLALYSAKYPKYYFNVLKAYILNPGERFEKNNQTCARLDAADGYHWFAKGDYSDELNVETTYDAFKAIKICDLYMQKTVALCQANNIPIYYVTMPMNEASYWALSAEYKAQYAEYIDALDVIPLSALNYSPNRLFSDASHFNTRGAQSFTKHLNTRLQTATEGR